MLCNVYYIKLYNTITFIHQKATVIPNTNIHNITDPFTEILAGSLIMNKTKMSFVLLSNKIKKFKR